MSARHTRALARRPDSTVPRSSIMAQYGVQHAIRIGQPAEHVVWVDGAEQDRTSRSGLPDVL